MASVLTFQGMGITIHQPWAAAIAFAGKDVENRTWYTKYRGPIAIHAGRAAWDEELLRWRVPANRAGAKQKAVTLEEAVRSGRRRFLEALPLAYPRSCILAVAQLVDCVQTSGSGWHEPGAWGFRLEDVVPIEPVAWTGARRLWTCAFSYRALAAAPKEPR